MGIKIRVKHLKLEHLTKYEKELTQRGEKLARMCSPLFVSLSCGQRWSRPKYDDLVISTESIKLSDSRTGIIETWKWIKRRIFENSWLCVFVMEKKSCGWRQYILSCENMLYWFLEAFSCLKIICKISCWMRKIFCWLWKIFCWLWKMFCWLWAICFWLSLRIFSPLG